MDEVDWMKCGATPRKQSGRARRADESLANGACVTAWEGGDGKRGGEAMPSTRQNCCRLGTRFPRDSVRIHRRRCCQHPSQLHRRRHWRTNGQRGDHPSDQESEATIPHAQGATTVPSTRGSRSLNATTRGVAWMDSMVWTDWMSWMDQTLWRQARERKARGTTAPS